MPRKVEDIVPNMKRSIRDIPLDEDVGETTGKTKKEFRGREVPIKKVMPISPPPIEKSRARTSRSWNPKPILVSLGVLVILGVGGYYISSIFARAVFTIVPRSVEVNVNANYVFNTTDKPDSQLYAVATATDSVTINVPATDGPKTETKAKGMMTVYNAYSPTARRLIAGTRFDSGNGNVYRLTSSIMIPGYSKSGTNIIPGKINAEVMADTAGAEYNVAIANAPEKYNVVAYKGTDKNTTIYGKQYSSFTGGFSGTKKVVDKDTLASTTKSLQSMLALKLMGEIKGSAGADTVMYDNGFIINYNPVIIGGNKAGEATVSISGNAYGVLLNKDQLVRKLAGDANIDSFKGMPYTVPGLEKLSFVINNPKEFSPSKGNTLVAQISGDITIHGQVPVDELKTKLAGLPLGSSDKIMRQYSPIINLEKTSGQVVPPWARIPTNKDKINIIVEK